MEKGDFYISKKKFKEIVIKTFYTSGLYICPQKIFFWKKKEVPQGEVQYIKTNRYVIPLPRTKEEKPKKKIKLYTFGLYLNKEYQKLLKSLNKKNSGFKLTYLKLRSPGFLSFIKKYSSNIKIDFTRALKSVCRLLHNNLFNYSWYKIFFSSSKFKFFLSTFYNDLFKNYIDPNKPLKRWKGWRLMPFKQASSLTEVRHIIFWQILFEKFGFTRNIKSFEKKYFKNADIDPEDKWYFWPTRRLFLLGLSEYDGLILHKRDGFFESFKKKPFLSTQLLLTDFQKRIFALFLYWRTILHFLYTNNFFIYKIVYSSEDNCSALVPILCNFEISNFFEFDFFGCDIEEINSFFENDYIYKKFDINKISMLGLNTPRFQCTDISYKTLYKLDLNSNFLKWTDKIFEKNILFEENLYTVKDSVNFLLTKSNKSLRKYSFSQRFYKKRKFFRLPLLIQQFFLLLKKKEVAFDTLWEFCFKPFINSIFSLNLESYLKEPKKEIIGASELNISSNRIYGSDAVITKYLNLHKAIQNYPVNFWRANYYAPFGPNPFLKTISYYSADKYLFPEAVSKFDINKIYLDNLLLNKFNFLNNAIFFGNFFFFLEKIYLKKKKWILQYCLKLQFIIYWQLKNLNIHNLNFKTYNISRFYRFSKKRVFLNYKKINKQIIRDLQFPLFWKRFNWARLNVLLHSALPLLRLTRVFKNNFSFYPLTIINSKFDTLLFEMFTFYNCHYKSNLLYYILFQNTISWINLEFNLKNLFLLNWYTKLRIKI